MCHGSFEPQFPGSLISTFPVGGGLHSGGSRERMGAARGVSVARVSGLAFRVSGITFRASNFGDHVSGSGFTVQSLGVVRGGPARTRVKGFEFRVSKSRFRIPGFKFRFPGFKFLVSGFILRVLGDTRRPVEYLCARATPEHGIEHFSHFRSGFRVPGFGFWVPGSGTRNH